MKPLEKLREKIRGDIREAIADLVPIITKGVLAGLEGKKLETRLVDDESERVRS